MQEELTQGHQFSYLCGQVSQLVAGQVQLHEACETADFWWNSSQVVVIQVERCQMLHLPQVGAEVPDGTW